MPVKTSFVYVLSSKLIQGLVGGQWPKLISLGLSKLMYHLDWNDLTKVGIRSYGKNLKKNYLRITSKFVFK